MSNGVKEPASPEPVKTEAIISDKARENFARLEQAREVEREARIRAEEQANAMRRELDYIKQMAIPKEKDPLDDLQDIADLDPNRLRASLSKRDAAMERKAEEIAKRMIEAEKANVALADKKNFLQRLRQNYSDYDSVMNESNIASLEKTSPEFLEAVLEIPDDFVRRQKTYGFIKKNLQQAESRPSIKEKVQENMENPYHIPTGSGMPTAVDFDIRSKSARDAAYQKLKEAQRKPIMNGGMSVR